jgi:hypothetical protein
MVTWADKLGRNLFSGQEKKLPNIKKEQNFKILIYCRDKLL